MSKPKHVSCTCPKCQRAETTEAALSEIRALPDEWVADCMNFKCTGKCSNAKCAAQLQAILEKYDHDLS